MSNSSSDEDCSIDLNDYKCSDTGAIVLPLINEYTWSIGMRGFLYLVGLLWCFLGVAIIADVFMCSIEKITSKTRRIRIADNDKEDGYAVIEVKVWNNTVANLTLMALGSSAPEILLACIEIVGAGFKAGPLGPSTIVGSAAFNLFVITGVCIFAVPSPDTRRIDAIKVFAITAFSCIFAYVWMLIVLKGPSPNYVDLWEAIVTLLFFPILIILAYLADKNFCKKPKVDDEEQVGLGFSELLFLSWFLAIFSVPVIVCVFGSVLEVGVILGTHTLVLFTRFDASCLYVNAPYYAIQFVYPYYTQLNISYSLPCTHYNIILWRNSGFLWTFEPVRVVRMMVNLTQQFQNLQWNQFV